MIVLILFVLSLFFGIIHSFIFVSKYNKIEVELIEKEELKYSEQIKQELNKQRNELTKQLEAVQYQLSLLDKLDNFRSDTLTDEKEVRKALSLEKQYNSLWTKERKLKRELEKLEKLDY